MAIQSFRDRRLELIFRGKNPGKGFPANLVQVTARKLRQLEAAETLDDFSSIPGSRLEPLRGGLAGRWSVRVNIQFRLVFTWTDGGPAEVEFVDYH